MHVSGLVLCLNYNPKLDYTYQKVRFRIFACCFTDQESKKGEKTYMAEVLGLTGSVSSLVKNKKKYHNY